MMSGICGINYAPLVLLNARGHYFTALSGYVNDYRTFGAVKNNTLWLKNGAKSLTLANALGKISAKGTQSLTLGIAQGLKAKIKTSAKGAQSLTLGIAQGLKAKIKTSAKGAKSLTLGNALGKTSTNGA